MNPDNSRKYERNVDLYILGHRILNHSLRSMYNFRYFSAFHWNLWNFFHKPMNDWRYRNHLKLLNVDKEPSIYDNKDS